MICYNLCFFLGVVGSFLGVFFVVAVFVGFFCVYVCAGGGGGGRDPLQVIWCRFS